ncbi:MAG TPA: hypothetical protein VFT32_10535 [Candidatus Eisenbacteria bacterium]|nr:hypothetical protein [Candidatus Eisenbacteria bacterium]
MDGSRKGPRNSRALGLALGALVLLFAPGDARAQIVSGLTGMTLNAVTPSSLTIAIPTGSSVNFALVQGGLANGSVPTVIQTSWSLNPGLVGAVRLYGYFSAPAAALAGTGYNIAAGYVEGRMTTGAAVAYAPFTQTNPVGPAGGSLLLYSETITGTNKNKTRSDNLDLRINLSASPPVPVGTYSGTLRIVARAL